MIELFVLAGQNTDSLHAITTKHMQAVYIVVGCRSRFSRKNPAIPFATPA